MKKLLIISLLIILYVIIMVVLAISIIDISVAFTQQNKFTHLIALPCTGSMLLGCIFTFIASGFTTAYLFILFLEQIEELKTGNFKHKYKKYNKLLRSTNDENLRI